MEVFKDIEGYENLYQISNLGRVKSLPQQGSGWFCKEYILKPRIRSGGYFVVGLTKIKVQKQKMIHRLIAIAFIPKVEGKKFINHKNGIKTDNRIENLEWCTISENTQHAFDTGLAVKAGKLIIDMETGVFYDTVEEAAVAKCITRPNLSKYLTGYRKNRTSYAYA